MMVFLFVFLQSGRADIHTGGCDWRWYILQQRCVWAWRRRCSFCPGEWKNLHKRSELKLGCEQEDYVVLPLFQEPSWSKYFTYSNLFNFPKALQGWYSSHPHRKLSNREVTCSVSPIQGNVELGFEPMLLTLICWDYGTEWGQEMRGGHSGLREQHR